MNNKDKEIITYKETDADLRWLKEAIDPILDRIMEYSTERWLYAEDNFEGVWNSVIYWRDEIAMLS